MKVKITVLPGDGIGPEVTDVALSILFFMGEQYGIELDLTSKLIGGSSYDQYNTPLTDDTLQDCYESDAVLLGAIGGTKWEDLPHEQKPESGLLKLRQSLELFSNLRPAKVYSSLVGASPLKPEIIDAIDILVVRELTSGIYFSTPRGYNIYSGWNTLRYTRKEVEQISRIAFEFASKRQNHVTSVHKANVLESSQFWRDVIHQVHRDYPQVALNDMYVDNAAMQLVRDPRQFDVLLTQNMFGDILSDIAGAITGSLGMLPSASLGKKHALYEPVHGSAPDISGKNIANPIAMISSVAMMFAYSFNLLDAANLIDFAINQTLSKGYRTQDIKTTGSRIVSTTQMGAYIEESLNELVEDTVLSTSIV